MTYLITFGLGFAACYLLRLSYEAWQSLLWLAEVEELRREAHE